MDYHEFNRLMVAFDEQNRIADREREEIALHSDMTSDDSDPGM